MPKCHGWVDFYGVSKFRTRIENIHYSVLKIHNSFFSPAGFVERLDIAKSARTAYYKAVSISTLYLEVRHEAHSDAFGNSGPGG